MWISVAVVRDQLATVTRDRSLNPLSDSEIPRLRSRRYIEPLENPIVRAARSIISPRASYFPFAQRLIKLRPGLHVLSGVHFSQGE